MVSDLTLGSPLPNTGWSGMTLMWKKGPKILLTSSTRPFTCVAFGFHMGCSTNTLAKEGWDTSIMRARRHCWNGPRGEILDTLCCKSLYNCSKVLLKPSGSSSNRFSSPSKNPGGNISAPLLAASNPEFVDPSDSSDVRSIELGARDGSGGCGNIWSFACTSMSIEYDNAKSFTCCRASWITASMALSFITCALRPSSEARR